MSAGLHRPGPIPTLARDQEVHTSTNLRPLGWHSGLAQHVERLAGGVGIAGPVPELAPAAVLVLASQESINLRPERLRRLARADFDEHPQAGRLRRVGGFALPLP